MPSLRTGSAFWLSWYSERPNSRRYFSSSAVANGTVVNIEDGVTTWEKDWPETYKWFGLKGVGPRSGALTGKGVGYGKQGPVGGVGEVERAEGGNTGGE
jgi:hypothetical protein